MHTSNASLKMSDYSINELLGKFQTDFLEAFFGQCRQLAVGKYDVSLRQSYKREKKFA